jgi:phosphonate transport system permease protein
VTGTVPRKPWSRSSVILGLVFFVFAAVTLGGFVLLDTKGIDVGAAFAQTGKDLVTLFLHPAATHFTVLEAVGGVAFTLALGLLTTVFGAVPAVVGGLLAARNLGPAWLSLVLRAFVSLIRAVPTVLWVLIFAIGAGLGSVAAVVGMTFHSFGYLLKAYSEAFEEVDQGTIEALRASGASWTSVIAQAAIPGSLPSLLSWTFLRFEINFTTAVAMGAAAGAGGVGFDLFMAAGYYFNLREVGAITWAILIVAAGLELGATRLHEANRRSGGAA